MAAPSAPVVTAKADPYGGGRWQLRLTCSACGKKANFVHYNFGSREAAEAKADDRIVQHLRTWHGQDQQKEQSA